ncbi:MAG TPA: carbamoyltransferase HypF [Stellaceae bacterium]|nr:carbamoyltransferase HypF [Stellaceae bacterium]
MSIADQVPPALEVRVRGRVQGVGFRPTVWRAARALGLAGEVLNDGEGVLLRVGGDPAALDALIDRLVTDLPPLARIDGIESRAYAGALPAEFRIAESAGGRARTEITPDAAICAACAAEIRDPHARRHRYPFTNCTHCGPRLTIVTAIPYDRAATTMAAFALCAACAAEYHDPADRRFHAEPTACPVCGPRTALVALVEDAPALGADEDGVTAAARLIDDGAILAIKGLGGYHLACDAANAAAVARLRRAKRREAKPFALMARDLAAIRRYATVDTVAERVLTQPAAPIVLLRADGPERLPEAVAPGLGELGFMLPTTPLHLLLLQRFARSLVMTSGNISDEPPVIDDAEACAALRGVADYALMHDRPIANRVDDSLVRIMGGRPRVLRRARGYAPASIRLPAGFEAAPELLAMGAELKATFCLVKDGRAILSQHQGDLERASVLADYQNTLSLFRRLFDHRPGALAIDRHPEYLSSKLARGDAFAANLPVIEVQHHHAHVASCLAENGRPLGAPPVLGIVLDGLGWGDDGEIWGGEFLLADYRACRRLARLKPVAMPGGAQAVREPWRNLYAQLASAGLRDAIEACPEMNRALADKPLRTLDRMIAGAVNAPCASSCGRLFDAVAAALGICADRQAYEGEAAMRLEALAARASADDRAYPFGIAEGSPAELDPAPLWRALVPDLARGTSTAATAARFHRGLSEAVVSMVARLADEARFDTVALSGGCFQNRLLFEGVAAGLGAAGFAVLDHAEVPSNDGGIALGQAAVAAARLMGD